MKEKESVLHQELYHTAIEVAEPERPILADSHPEITDQALEFDATQKPETLNDSETIPIVVNDDPDKVILTGEQIEQILVLEPNLPSV